MDRLALDVVPIRHGRHNDLTIAIRVNNRRLERLAHSVELPHAKAGNAGKLAGRYAPLALPDINSDRSHFLGRPVASWFDDGDTVLMGCSCGVWGCWPLTAQVELDHTTVTWASFRNGHREWDLSALGPFTFDRTEYEAELDVIG